MVRPFDRHRPLLLLALLLGALGCEVTKPRAATTFYERRIGPILKETCANSPTQSGCHVAADTHGNAFGNLNVTSYESVIKRRDLLVPYGPYLLPALLVKVLPPFQVRLTTWKSADPLLVTTDIPHVGGSLIDVTSNSFNELIQWIGRGATENNSVAPARDAGRTPCSTAVAGAVGFDGSVDPPDADYATFRSRVLPVLAKNCSAGNCHGSPSNSLYLTCAETTEQERWNYFATGDYVSVDPESSELLRRTVAVEAGGTYHEGGALFSGPGDPGYKAILEWAKEKGKPTHESTDPGFVFFADRVQPMLVKKGCMLLGCHAPAMGHEYRLRSGSGGHFGLPATRHNYNLTLEQVALESDDPNVSRVLRKNLVPFVERSPVPFVPAGILHRGGALFGAGRTDCDAAAAETGPLDEQEPYCVVRRWIELERAARMATAKPLSAILYVKRPAASGQDIPQDFETFRPGADLIQAGAALDATTGDLSVQAGASSLGACGLPAGIDVRRPAVSWDGSRIAFSARTSAAEPWRIFVLEGSTCAVEPTVDAAPVDDAGSPLPLNGELVHNFDPAFAPDGRLVFTSTRGNVMNAATFDYQGPQRSPADPSRQNANLYVAEDGKVRQLTFLLNQELTPAFMSDGRVILTAEKRAPGFYQLAARRQNLDGGDYHPLFGQRRTIGYRQVTDVVELPDKNFAAIFSDAGAAHGAGAFGVVNRSLGVDQESGEPADYAQDRGARDWPNPRFYQHAVRILDGVGRPGDSGGVFRSPTPLPNGRILVSYADAVADVAAFPGGFDLVVVNPVTGARSAPVVSDADDLLWPVAVYARPDRGVVASRLDEPNGASRVNSTDDRTRADVTFLDVPLLSSLLFQNTRSRRILAPDGAPVEAWEDLPPESGVTTFAAGGSFVTEDAFGQIYVRRRLIGQFTPLEDGSAHVLLPGGKPIVLAPIIQLSGDTKPARHHQREQMQFYPGEAVRQGFRRQLFDGVCGSCHGAVSGYDADISANPDILTQASQVAARSAAPKSLLGATGAAKGPPFP